MNFDTTKLRAQIISATQAAINKIKTETLSTEICGFALYTDSDATSLAASFNSKVHLAKMQEQYPEDPIYLKWAPAEWAHEDFGSEFFSDISKTMTGLSDSVPDGSEFLQYRNDIFNTCVEALKDIRASESDECIFVFSVTDSLDPETETRWIKELNSPSEATEFEEWIFQQ